MSIFLSGRCVIPAHAGISSIDSGTSAGMTGFLLSCLVV